MFLANRPWAHITKLARASTQPADIAVAYVGSKADTLLPIKPASRLVVDASLACVQAGSTNPTTLINFHKRGVRIFSRPLLHAKTFVFDDLCIVGSTNISLRSQRQLFEAAIISKDPSTVASARAFVREVASDELNLKSLRWLEKQYNPPKPGSPLIPPDDSSPRLIMQLTDRQGYSGHQVQPPSGVWRNFFNAGHSDRGRVLRFRDRDSGREIERAVVAHAGVLTIDIPDYAIGDLWEVFQVGLDTYEYRIAPTGSRRHKALDKELHSTPNPAQQHGRLWTITETPKG